MNLDFFGLLPHYLFLAIAADNLYLQFISIYNLYISNKEAGRKKCVELWSSTTHSGGTQRTDLTSDHWDTSTIALPHLNTLSHLVLITRLWCSIIKTENILTYLADRKTKARESQETSQSSQSQVCGITELGCRALGA